VDSTQHHSPQDGAGQNTPGAPAAPNGASTKAKARQRPLVRFPLRFHFAISEAMGRALQRQTGGNSLMSEADIGRLALHAFLLSNDPQYREEVSSAQ
jgi:hypothetical protein